MQLFPRAISVIILSLSVFSHAGTPLQQPKVLTSKNGALNLEMNMTKGMVNTACHTVTTRLYQIVGEVPTAPGVTL